MSETVTPVTAGWSRSGEGAGLGRVALIAGVAVAIQVLFMPRLDIGPLEATPNLVVAAVVAAGVWRGVIVGAVTGFASGLLVELILPGDTLGVLALAYVAIGAWCGRFASSSQPPGRMAGLGLVAAACAVAPLWVALVELLRGASPEAGYVITDLVLPQVVFSPLVALPVWWAARRLLGTPREVEPWGAR